MGQIGPGQGISRHGPTLEPVSLSLSRPKLTHLVNWAKLSLAELGFYHFFGHFFSVNHFFGLAIDYFDKSLLNYK